MSKFLDETGLRTLWSKITSKFQPYLVSGVNIKTIGGTSLLGGGNILITGDMIDWSSMTDADSQEY